MRGKAERLYAEDAYLVAPFQLLYKQHQNAVNAQKHTSFISRFSLCH
jgi:hypothetical protein